VGAVNLSVDCAGHIVLVIWIVDELPPAALGCRSTTKLWGERAGSVLAVLVILCRDLLLICDARV